MDAAPGGVAAALPASALAYAGRPATRSAVGCRHRAIPPHRRRPAPRSRSGGWPSLTTDVSLSYTQIVADPPCKLPKRQAPRCVGRADHGVMSFHQMERPASEKSRSWLSAWYRANLGVQQIRPPRVVCDFENVSRIARTSFDVLAARPGWLRGEFSPVLIARRRSVGCVHCANPPIIANTGPANTGRIRGRRAVYVLQM